MECGFHLFGIDFIGFPVLNLLSRLAAPVGYSRRSLGSGNHGRNNLRACGLCGLRRGVGCGFRYDIILLGFRPFCRTYMASWVYILCGLFVTVSILDGLSFRVHSYRNSLGTKHHGIDIDTILGVPFRHSIF